MAALTIPVDKMTGGFSSTIREKMTAAFCWGEEPVAWHNPESIAEIIGVEKNQSNFTAIGYEARKFEGVKTMRTNKGRFVLLPRVKI